MGGCAGKKSAGLVPCSGAVATSLGIFHPRLALAREERARFVSRPASGTFLRKLPVPRPKPPPPLSWPRPPLSPWRRPASAVTAALSSRGCWGGGESLTPGLVAACLRCRSRRPDLGCTGMEQPRGSVGAGGGGRLPRASECLRRDPPHTCPPRSGSPPAV